MSGKRGQSARHTTFFLVREALEREGCPVCRLSLGAAGQHLDGLVYEGVNDPGLRSRLRRSRGFCPHHGWQLLRFGSGSFSIAILYADVLGTVSQILSEGVERGFFHGQAGGAEVSERLAPNEACPACRVLAEAQSRYLYTLLDHTRDEDFARAYRVSDGLCLPHLTVALKAASDERARGLLIDTALEKLSAPTARPGMADVVERVAGAPAALIEPETEGPESGGEAKLAIRPSGKETLGSGRSVSGCPICALSEKLEKDLLSVSRISRPELCGRHLRRLPWLDQPALATAARDTITIVASDATAASASVKGIPLSLLAALKLTSSKLDIARSPVCSIDHRHAEAEAGWGADLAGSGEAELGTVAGRLCFRHLCLVLSVCPAERVPLVVHGWNSTARGLVGELREYVRKHDYRFSREPWGDERTSPQRAVESMVGREAGAAVGGMWWPKKG